MICLRLNLWRDVLRMKVICFLFFFIYQPVIFSQTLSKGKNIIPEDYYIDWSQAGLLPEFRDGLYPETPLIAENIYIINNSGDCSNQNRRPPDAQWPCR